MGKYLDSIGLSHFMGLIKQALAGKSDTGHTHAAGDMTSGTLAIGRIPTGTTSSTVALGNHDHGSLYLKRQPSGTSELPQDSSTTEGFPIVLSDTFANNGVISYMTKANFKTFLGLGSAASMDTGNTASTVALGNHTHSQYYDSGISRTANTVLAAPNGSAGGATFRKLVVADVPTGDTSSTVALGNHTHSGYAASSHTHAAGDINSGTLALARIPTGTTSSTVALGNHDHSSLYLPLSGGTETGAVSFKASNIDKANPSSSATWGNARINLQDKNGNNMAYILPYVGTDGFYGMCFGCDGNYTYIRTDGSSPKTTFTNAAAWRTGLGLGSAATMNTGTTATTVALGNHTHNNYYFHSAQSATSVAIGSTSAYNYLIILYRSNSTAYSQVQKGAATSPLASTVVYTGKDSSNKFYVSLTATHKISATSVQIRHALATVQCGTSGTVTLSNQMYVNLGNGSSGTQEVGAQTDFALVGVIGVY